MIRVNGCGRNKTNTHLMGSMSFDRLEVRLFINSESEGAELEA